MVMSPETFQQAVPLELPSLGWLGFPETREQRPDAGLGIKDAHIAAELICRNELSGQVDRCTTPDYQ